MFEPVGDLVVEVGEAAVEHAAKQNMKRYKKWKVKRNTDSAKSNMYINEIYIQIRKKKKDKLQSIKELDFRQMLTSKKETL